MKTFSVIGAGRAGRTIGLLMRRAGWTPLFLSCRTRGSALAAARFVGGGRATTDNAAAVRGARIVILGVPDREIVPAWREIVRYLEPGTAAFHLCGNESASILSPRGGARTGSIHPLRSFADPGVAASGFKGTFCAVEGPPILRRLVRSWGGIPFAVDPRRKPVYHISAVFSSNYLVALIDAAAELMQRCGVSRPLPPVLAMASGALRNLQTLGLPAALTGPIDRGDVETVRRHLRALSGLPRGLEKLYAELGRRTCRVARRKGTSSRLKAIEAILRSR